MEASKSIIKNILVWVVQEWACQLSMDVNTYKYLFDSIISQSLPSPCNGNGDLYPKIHYDSHFLLHKS